MNVELEARQIVDSWRSVDNGNNDALLRRYIKQAIEAAELDAKSDRYVADVGYLLSLLAGDKK